jgi:hypothetical protein
VFKVPKTALFAATMDATGLLPNTAITNFMRWLCRFWLLSSRPFTYRCRFWAASFIEVPSSSPMAGMRHAAGV